MRLARARPQEFSLRRQRSARGGAQNDRRRDDALRLQGDLTRAQIDKMKAETDSISRGDALIKIDGAGLQPHLEAFMWEILKTIQTRVNQDGLKMLLGA